MKLSSISLGITEYISLLRQYRSKLLSKLLSVEIEKVMANPEEYVMFNKKQKRRVLSTLEEFSENFTNMCGKCMDVGCGPGDITKNILLPALGSNAQLIGTDISESMIKFANETYSDKKRLQFEVLDIQTKNLPKKYISEFNHILSFHALQLCNDIGQAYKNIYKMLRPNGTILLYIVAYQDIYEVFKILKEDIRFTQYIPDSMNNISPYQKSNNARKELKEELESVGFTVHHCSLRDISESNEKPEEFLKTIMSILSFLNDMPQNLMEEFKNTFMYEFMKRKIKYESLHNDQELTLDQYKVLIAYAQKI